MKGNAEELRYRAIAVLGDPKQQAVHPDLAHDLSVLIGSTDSAECAQLARMVVHVQHESEFVAPATQPPPSE